MSVLGLLLEGLFPAGCVGCGRTPAALCPACLAGARPAMVAEARPPPGVDWWVAAFAYEGVVREALARLKYRNARGSLPLLATTLVGRLREEAPGPVDVVTWPPTGALRRRQRGFDQAEHLARAVGRGLGVPVRPLLLRRAGPSQTGRSAEERRRGPAFDVLPAGAGVVGGRRVLVVDDVATTGATLAAAARALRASGARLVGAATVARTLRRAGVASGADRSRWAQAAPEERRYSRCEPRSDRGRVGFGEEPREAMERINPVTVNRQDVIVRLRRQVAEGAYQPPVDEIVNRLVSAVMAHRADSGCTPRSLR